MKIIKKLILLASGEGSNVENIIKHFELNSNIEVVLVAGNNKKAYVFEMVKKYDIDTFVFDKNFFDKKFINIIEQYNPNLIVLAGFLWKIPEFIINKYPNQIINIHESNPTIQNKNGVCINKVPIRTESCSTK